ncbi:rCG59104 [Rattus norvegicus]|uniref:RCG59104 n=1 Tax=Rattus norvegicus TaxID=10116 RepID=A6JPS3_RAT|nr:rCG59104 [Rattus norvegicus]
MCRIRLRPMSCHQSPVCSDYHLNQLPM